MEVKSEIDGNDGAAPLPLGFDSVNCFLSPTIMNSQSNLLQVGQQCSIETCSLQDFLPFKCQCDQVFCRDHIFPETHLCTAIRPVLTNAEVAATGSKVKKCDVEGCNKPTLYAFSNTPDRESCENCKRSYCVL
jgi:AN1-like Zinc finger